MPIWAANIVNNCMNVQPGEKVCIIVDEALGFVRDALEAEVSKLHISECWSYTPKAQLTGNFISDEKVMGTAHFALGNNTDMPIGGVNRAPMHVDLLVDKPTVTVDGRAIMIDGKVAG
ncbi:MAG: hypothetical protein M1319_01065 [Chloroflexi bacterium]|nr:hypothetical protein [Chloroflexota bacterium]